MKCIQKITIVLCALILFGAPLSGQGYKYCILVRQKFDSWGECRNGAPGFEKAELSIYTGGNSSSSTITIEKNQINKIIVPFQETFTKKEDSPIMLNDFEKIEVHVWANNIRNDTHTVYEIKDDSTWHQGLNPTEGKSASDPCSNNANWSGNREGYNNSTDIFIEGPVMIEPSNRSEPYDYETENLKLSFEPFEFYNDNQTAFIQYTLTPNDSESWKTLKEITPGKNVYIAYSEIAGDKTTEGADFFNFMDRFISFRIRKKLANGSYSTGNLQQAKFTSSGPDFRVLDVKRSYCNDNPVVFVEVLDSDDGLTFSQDRFWWTAKKINTDYPVECTGTIIEGTTYRLVPDNSSTNPFTQAGEWELQLQIQGNDSINFTEKTFAIPEKSDPIDIDQSDEIYPINSASPSYHLLDATNPYAIINIDDDELRLPYQIKKIDGTDTLFIATLNHIPNGFEDLSEGEQNNIWENFTDSIDNEKGNRDSNWGKYFNLRFEDWFFEKKKKRRTDITTTTPISGCDSEIGGYLFALSQNSRYLVYGYVPSIVTPSDFNLYSLVDGNISNSTYHEFWKTHAKSGFTSNGIRYYTFDDDNTDSGTTFDGFGLSITNGGLCYTNFPDQEPTIQSTAHKGTFEIQDYNGCSIIGKDNSGNFSIIKTMGHQIGQSVQLENFHTGILDATGTKCAYTNENGSTLFYYPGEGSIRSWPGNIISNIRYISNNELVNYIIYDDSGETRWLQYIIGDFNKDYYAERFFEEENLHDDWYNDYVATQWQKYLAQNYGYKLNGVKTNVKENYILTGSDRCDYSFEIEVKVPPQPVFDITNSVAPSTECSSDGQLTIKCTTAELLPLSNDSTTLTTVSQVVTFGGLAWTDTIQFYNSSLGLTYNHPISFADPARGIQDAKAQPRTCGEFANGKIAIEFASNSASEKTYIITDQNNNTTEFSTTSNSCIFDGLDGNTTYRVSVSTDECTVPWGEELLITNKIFEIEAHKTDAAIIGEDGSAEITVTNLPDNATWTGTAYAEGTTPDAFALGNHTIEATHNGCTTSDSFEILEPGFTADAEITKKEGNFVVSITDFQPNDQVVTGSLVIQDDQGNTYEENVEIPASNNYSIVFNYDGHTEQIYDFSNSNFNNLSTDHSTTITEQKCPGDEVTVTINPESSPLKANFEGIFVEDLSFLTSNSLLEYYVRAEEATNAIVASCRLDINLAIESAASVEIEQATAVTGTFKYADVSCFGRGDGHAEVFDLSGGSGSYEWSVSPDGPWIDGNETNNTLSPGNYNVYLKDSENNCEEVQLGSFPIEQPRRLTIHNNDIIEPTCELDNGSISARVTGGNLMYKYEWKLNDATISKSNTCTEDNIFELLDTCQNGGQYQLIVEDTLGCRRGRRFNLRSYTNPSISGAVQDSARCYNEHNGSIEIEGFNSSTYDVDSLLLSNEETAYADTITNWESVMKFRGLAAGQYALTVSDEEGCHSNTPWVISVFEPDSLYLLTDTIRPVIDKGESSGIIRGRVFNGNPGLKYMTLMPDTAPGTVTDTLRAINERPYAFRNINAGTYLIQTADHKGCTFMSSPLVVTEPEEALDFKVISRQDALCKAMTGSFEVQGTGGWGDYEYKRIIENAPVDNEAGFTNLQSFDGLSAGSYIVTVKDALGAIFKDTVLILSPTEFLHASAEDIVHPSCGNDGRFNVAIGGGTAPYKLSFINSADTIQASGEAPVEYTNRPAGAYTLMISDDMGCHFNLETELTNDSLLTIEQPLQSGYPTAPGRSNGWLLANATGGNQPLTWQWNDGKTGLPISDGNSPMLEGIPSGYYEIAVSDAGDCSQTESFYLSDIHDGVMDVIEIHGETSWQAANGFVRLLSPLLPIDSIEVVHPDKSIEILKSMNELPAGYSLQEDTLTVEDMMPGDWLISAFYPDGTKAAAQFDIDAYEELTFSDIKVTHTLEYGDAKGRIEANISGGIGPFEYQWEGLTGHLRLADINHFSNKSIADHLVTGSYLLTVTDQYDNQISTEKIVLGPEKPLELEIAEYENENCKNARNAYVRVNASGGWGEYQYRHDDAQTFQNGSAWMELPPREHTFYLIDKRGAEREVSIFITEPDSLRAAVSLIDSVKCYGNANGAVSFNISGGTAPYKFITDNQEELWTTDTTATDLTAGTYTFLFSDANNCVGYDTLTTTVHEPQPLEFSRINVIHTTCNTDNGAMAVSMQGGTAPYYYEWMDASGAEVSTSDSISGLAQGEFYSVNVSDQNDCPQYLEQTINPSTNPAITEIETTPVLCYGDSNGKAKVVGVEAATPDAPYHFIWSDNQEGASADGFEAGTHYVTVRDTNLCESTRYFEVKTPDTLGINILEIRDAHCYGYNDGLIRLEAKGGVGQYEFSWSNGDSTATASNLAKGGYSVLINDSNDCVFEQGFVIDEPQMETVDAGEDILMCPGNAITIDGKNFAAHLWTAEGDTLSNERYFTVDSEGAFFLKVTNYRGCFAYDTINVKIGNDALQADFLMTSEAFLNDTLEIFEISNLPLDSMTWEYDVDIFSDQTPAIADDYVLHLKTLQTGMYNVTLYAYSGGCFSNMAKQVEIIEGDGSQVEDEIMGYQDPLIKSFIVSPNPNPGNFSVDVELRETAEIHLAVFSVTEGIKIDDKSNTGMDEYHERFTMNGINTGVYVVVLTVEGERRQVKIVVE